MSTVADYVGRTIDIAAWRGARVNGVVRLEETLADKNSTGEICTGIQKLAQRFLLELLTPVGTMKYHPRRGTDFIRQFRRGEIRTETDLRAAFAMAELRARANLRAEETADDPDDERYKKSELVAAVVSPGKVIIKVRLYSLADKVEIVLPISVVV